MAEELRQLYLWYGVQMDQCSQQEDFLRFQACRRLLKSLFSGDFEDNITSRYQVATKPVEDYMAQDAFGSEPQ